MESGILGCTRNRIDFEVRCFVCSKGPSHYDRFPRVPTTLVLVEKQNTQVSNTGTRYYLFQLPQLVECHNFLFVLILKVTVNNFFSHIGMGLPGLTQY